MALSRKYISVIFILLASVAVFAAVLGSAIYFAYQSIPSIDNIEKCFKTSMYNVDLCPGKPGYVNYNALPKHLVQSLIAAEDSGFYFHQGFDMDEMKDAMEKSFDAGRWVRGGSTITQQLAKNLYLTKEKSLVRKIKELIVAKNIENKLSKSKIIEKYFNVVEFGPSIFGISKASRTYFQKPPSELTPAEGAYLVSLLPSPVKYSSAFRRNKELSSFNKKRVRHILHILKLQKKLSEEEYDYEISRMENGLWNPAPFTQDLDSPTFFMNLFRDDSANRSSDQAESVPTQNLDQDETDEDAIDPSDEMLEDSDY
jgi:monofunctional glycosyltransferase